MSNGRLTPNSLNFSAKATSALQSGDTYIGGSKRKYRESRGRGATKG